MRRRPPKTVLEVAVAVGGYRKGFRVCQFIAQWTIAQKSLGHEPTIDQAAAWWKEPRSTWFLRQTEFREVFDLLENPGHFAAQIIADVDARVESTEAALAYLGRLPLPAAAATA